MGGGVELDGIARTVEAHALRAITGQATANRKQNEAIGRELEILERQLQDRPRKPDSGP